MFRAAPGASALCVLLTIAASAQDLDPPKNIPFAGGTFTITQNEDFERVLAYGGREIARNYMLFHDRDVKLGDVDIALFSIGDGGNACGASTVIAWKAEGAALESVVVGDGCDGAPPASVAEDRINFVPYLLPGQTSTVQSWSPDEGVKVVGSLSFLPQPGTGWGDFKADTTDYMVDAFDNAAIYEAGKALLGADLTGVITGLLTGGDAEIRPDGTITGYGCVPHACGASDTFMGIDPKAQKLYFAQQDEPRLRAWPDLAGWPAALKTAMEAAIGPDRQN